MHLDLSTKITNALPMEKVTKDGYLFQKALSNS